MDTKRLRIVPSHKRFVRRPVKTWLGHTIVCDLITIILSYVTSHTSSYVSYCLINTMRMIGVKHYSHSAILYAHIAIVDR
jgi:hypothetical protein